MRHTTPRGRWMLFGIFATALTVSGIGKAQESETKKSSYAPEQAAKNSSKTCLAELRSRFLQTNSPSRPS